MVLSNHRPKIVWMLLATLSVCLPLLAQTSKTAVPTVTLTFDFPGSDPEHFEVSVQSDCLADYESNGKLTEQSDETEPFHDEFNMSKTGCDHIFDLAQRAHYFTGEIDSKRRNLASTGRKTLSYKDAERSAQATYNYSPVPAVQELTALFQNLSTTLEFGRRLQFDQHYQKPALDEELRLMEESAKNNDLVELQAVAPILQKIAQDASVMNVARARALRLLQKAGANASGQ